MSKTNMRFIWWSRRPLLFACLLLIGCNDNYDLGLRDDNGNHPAYYGMESEPSLSLDHKWVYFTVTDTAYPPNTGIYRASAETAIREQVASVVGAHTPAITTDNRTIVFVKDGQLKLLALESGQVASVGTNAANAVAVGSAQYLVKESGGSLTRVTLSGELSALAAGQYPTGIAIDSITYLTRAPGEPYSVWRAQVSTAGTAKIGDLPDGLTAQWPSTSPNSPLIVFTVPVENQFRILRYNTSTSEMDTLGLSLTAKTCVLADGSVIFTGSDGRLWYISQFGGAASPWTHTEE